MLTPFGPVKQIRATRLLPDGTPSTDPADTFIVYDENAKPADPVRSAYRDGAPNG